MRIRDKTTNEAIIRKDLTIIPKIIENNTRFFLYSFFKGLKKVTKSPWREKSRMQ